MTSKIVIFDKAGVKLEYDDGIISHLDIRKINQQFENEDIKDYLKRLYKKISNRFIRLQLGNVDRLN